MKLYSCILKIALFLTGLQWIKMTFAMAILLKIGEIELLLGMLNSYYLVMICIILCSGFLNIQNLNNKTGG